MKKTYVQPEIYIAETRTQSLICTSGVRSGVRSAEPYDIEWGDVDEEGLCDPD